MLVRELVEEGRAVGAWSGFGQHIECEASHSNGLRFLNRVDPTDLVSNYYLFIFNPFRSYLL